MRGKKEFVTNDRNSWFNRSKRNTERNNGRCNVPFRGVHVDLAINVSPLMALRTRLDFHWKIPEENFYCKSWQWRWRGPGKVSEKDGWRGPRTRRLQDVQLSPRFERNGSNVTILGWSTGYWLRARFSFEPGFPSSLLESQPFTIRVSGHQSSTRFLAIHSREELARSR